MEGACITAPRVADGYGRLHYARIEEGPACRETGVVLDL